MAGGRIQTWNEWATQILVLLSFTLQIFLFLFARTSRRGPSAVLKFILWLAYLMADSTAVYTLGHLSISGSLREQKLTVFWAPFLLVHLGSQDTITAYALEDNKLWPRHLLNLSVQAFGVAYVLYKHISEIPTSLGLATGLMFVTGFIKYGERICALKCATLDSILTCIREFSYLPTYYSALPSLAARAEERDEEELLLFAQGMLPRCKGAIADFPVALFGMCKVRDGYMKMSSDFELNWNWNWKATVKVVEMELSLMYDILYTKAAVIHNWYGYCIRVFSPLATIVVFILFQLSGNKDDYSKADLTITYILLVGSFLLDLASLLSALGSTWACNSLLTRGWIRLGLVILFLRQHVKAARGNRRWSGSIGQFNLLHFCSRDSTKLSIRVAKMMRLEDWWNKWHYVETLVISEDAKELVFRYVWQALKEIHDPRGKDETQSRPYMERPMAMMTTKIYCMGFGPEPYEDTARRRMKLAEALGFGAELQEVILTWHVFTDVFLLFSRGIPKDKDATSSTYVKAIKALSDYMVFLVAIIPDTIPGLELHSLYKATHRALEVELRFSCEQHVEEQLASIMQNRTHVSLGGASIILSHGFFYAKLLLELLDAGNPDKLGVISTYEDTDDAAMDKLKRLIPDLEPSCRGGVFGMPEALALILDAWVRLLIFLSARCSRDVHARQISHGGEIRTIVWLMEEHASMFFKRPETGRQEAAA
ncbi:hypothetical protein ZWY2020_010521 [Hordeum vulgare]|nr:hypothetical protein ZWY2020_010521 [Hordeum vulgare]